MKRKLSIAATLLLLVLAGSASSGAKIPEPSAYSKALPTAPAALKSRDGQTPSIDFIRGDFGGPYWADGWLWVKPGQAFRINWRADSGSVRWCNRWSLDPQFRGPTRSQGEYWTRLYGPNPNAAHGGWPFGITCGNGVTPNAVTRIWVKVV